MIIDARFLKHKLFEKPSQKSFVLDLIRDCIEQNETKTIYLDTKDHKPVKARRNCALIRLTDEKEVLLNDLQQEKLVEFVKTIEGDDENIYQFFKLSFAAKKKQLIKEHPKLEDFMERFRSVTAKRATADFGAKKNFNAAMEKDYSVSDLIFVTQRALEDTFHIENDLKYITPEYVTRERTINKYINVKPKKAYNSERIDDLMNPN